MESGRCLYCGKPSDSLSPRGLCSECEKIIPEDNEQNDAKYCPMCGKANVRSAEKCDCGYRFNGKEETNLKSSRRLITFNAIAGVILGAGAFFAMAGSGIIFSVCYSAIAIPVLFVLHHFLIGSKK